MSINRLHRVRQNDYTAAEFDAGRMASDADPGVRELVIRLKFLLSLISHILY